MEKLQFFALLLIIQTSPSFAEIYGPRPADWTSHLVNNLEIIEINSPAEFEPKGTLLMIPGFFQNAASFDLMPEKEQKISIARFLMDKFHLKIYLLNSRGLGLSTPTKRLSLDDLAAYDIPTAIKWVSEQVHSKIYVLGHSQGGITLQASLAGLDYCGEGRDCFKKESAEARQAYVKGIALSGANVDMTTDDDGSQLSKLGRLGMKLRGLLLRLTDRIVVRNLTTKRILSHFAYSKPWEFLYHRENASKEAQLALYQRTIEASSTTILVQYINGINDGGIRALGSEEKYSDHLSDIKVPSVQVTYGLDPMALPSTTLRDDFNRVGSSNKKFYTVEGQGHEDWMMNPEMHSDWEAPIIWLMAQ